MIAAASVRAEEQIVTPTQRYAPSGIFANVIIDLSEHVQRVSLLALLQRSGDGKLMPLFS
ncbi:hypothetical protein BBW68_02485 [Candidatus Erwinia dacicola]|uniref:Uncharacterized protein n=1 Tax=Candidatus Erwinia dacicola TaxID=252393 RepID=A0A1E7YVI8_9GAMM|nr:hypothetical protein BBW68_02485 [Candidatus Erwinia dacicola]